MAEHNKGENPGSDAEMEDAKPRAVSAAQGLVGTVQGKEKESILVQKTLHLHLVFPRGADDEAIDPAGEHFQVLQKMQEFDPDMIVRDMKNHSVNMRLDFPQDEYAYKTHLPGVCMCIKSTKRSSLREHA